MRGDVGSNPAQGEFSFKKIIYIYICCICMYIYIYIYIYVVYIYMLYKKTVPVKKLFFTIKSCFFM